MGSGSVGKLSRCKEDALDAVIRAEFRVVVDVHGDDVGEDILTREREVLEDEVDLLVGVFDARDRNVAQLLDEARDDLLTDIRPQCGFEFEIAFRVKEQVLRQLPKIVSEPDTRRVMSYVTKERSFERHTVG